MSGVALVTGASRGIGRECALAFARAGFDVAITARTVREGQGRAAPRTRVKAFNLSPGFVITESGKARGGADAIVDAGFAATPVSVPAAAAVWLATDPDADRFLGRVVDGPKLMATLEETV
ncbi:SDR family NAD(P)-dependent oxidoreductase [Rhodococcus sp. IEGM 1409]|uniref:SDR family NAD(P)-dependent oxidoreductase n=1 Tax=Rhodococcus sp. IEGM 1409 TaxID=3047082 RepID=UPI0024B738EE|nr:SDR family NAD(P)-dependent oxidoreductase [Rhodococcus sp. IEGM 1409]MDI9899272.1 SDR family NAD(P)-dependent oxidoreductase [Rhodococcus sp. IEGM 1409]